MKKTKKTKLRSTSDVRVPSPKAMAPGMNVKETKMGPGFSRTQARARMAKKVSAPSMTKKKSRRYA